MSKVAVVILNFNGREYLSRFLPPLIQHSSNTSIYVVDNASQDDSIQVLAQFPEIHIIQLTQNHGYAQGYNEGLRQISAEYYLLINSDVEVTPHWVDPLVTFLDSNPGYCAVQPKILDYTRREYFEYAGAAGGFVDLLGYPYCRGRIFNSLETDNGQYDEPIDTFWASGACFLIRSSVFWKYSGFDDGFFAHMEEIDLCWRIKSGGGKIACVPQSVIYHVGGGTLNKTSPRKTYLNFRNGISLLAKNLPYGQLIWVLPVRIFLDWMAGLLFWKNQSFAHFAAVLKAHLHALQLLKVHLRITTRSGPALPQQRGFSVAIAYFLMGKRKFDQLNNTR